MKINKEEGKKSFRYGLLDSLRGLVLISMILYHACWDLVYIFGRDWNWYTGTGAYIWQQSICWSFILLSGFCWSLGKHPVKRGSIVFAGGAVVSLVTILLMPENKVVFGVLTLIGSCMLFMAVLSKVIEKVRAFAGLILSAGLFFLTRNINGGYLGFERWNLLKLPKFLYRGSIMTFLGFTEPGFYSTDYFSFFPWFFLYLVGYFLFHVIKEVKDGQFMDLFFRKECSLLSFFGKHSLIIYMLHQPLMYGILAIIF
ncbi:MAG: DUF1624 domain-containing protein [Lachnospiraceae bacterium]|nr:DUF1624 domain-containing protein [Lachnospiraceae bacterium]